MIFIGIQGIHLVNPTLLPQIRPWSLTGVQRPTAQELDGLIFPPENSTYIHINQRD